MKKITIKATIIAMVMIITPILSPLVASETPVADPWNETAQWAQKTAPAPSLDAKCVIKLAQNAETVVTETEAAENCCSTDIETCQAEIKRLQLENEALQTDPPEIPVKSWLAGFKWFQNLSPPLQTLIGTVGTAAIVAALTYLGSLAK